jgi:hypothetical protein
VGSLTLKPGIREQYRPNADMSNDASIIAGPKDVAFWRDSSLQRRPHNGQRSLSGGRPEMLDAHRKRRK